MLNAVISAAFTRNERTAPLLDGAVAPAGIDWTAVELTPGDLFFRQLKFAEFDISELSMSSFAIAAARGDRTWIALPVFTTRDFFHTGIIVREDSPLRTPADLRGRRVGVLEYQQTSVVWIRGVLEHEFGVNATDVEWFMERRPERSHGGATGFAPPPGVRLTYVPEETSLAAMLQAGELEAVLFLPPAVDAIDFKSDGARERLRWRTLFADPAAEGRRYHAATGITPVNHGVVLRRSLVEERPELAPAVYAAFLAAHGPGPPAYGIRNNRATLETLVTYLHEQGLTPRRLALEELFVAGTGDW